MTEITDAMAAEVLWASDELGKAAVRAAWDKAKSLGLGTRSADIADIGAIVYAAYLAAGWDAGPTEADEPELAGCEHKWAVLKVQAVSPSGITFGKPIPHTAALARCRDCGQPESWLLAGEWKRDDLAAWTDPSLAGQWEPVPR
jgi:hypothetical protein